MRLEQWITRLEEILMTTVTILMVLMVFIQIVCRYVLKMSLQGTEELARYLMITGTFLGASIAVKNRAHIQVELRHLFQVSTGAMKIWDLFVNLIAFSSLCLIGWYVFKALPEWSNRSTALNIPMIFPMGAVLIGIILMIIHYIFLIYSSLYDMKTRTEED